MNKNVYTLYHNKEKQEIKVQKLAVFQSNHIKNNLKATVTSEKDVVYHNDCYYLSFSRKSLLQKAREIKAEWIKDCEEQLEKINSIVIK